MILYKTKRLLIREFVEADIEHFMEYRNNDEWMKYQSFKNLDKDTYIKKLIVPFDIVKGSQLAIILKEEDKLIGDIFLIKDKNRIDIGFTIHPNYARKGYIKEVVKELINYIQENYKNHTIFAETELGNEASISLLKQLHFSEELVNELGHVFEYKIKQLSFDDLEEYNKIEMLKEFNRIRYYKDLHTYDIHEVETTVFDFSKDENMTLWREIMVHDQCAVFVIQEKKEYVAGAVVVTNSPNVNMLRSDMENSVLWDIRVDSKHQQRGYGKILFEKAVEFAKNKQTKRMIIETQNNNPKAIQFYEKMGCKLIEINRNHYKGLDEDQLIFIKEF